MRGGESLLLVWLVKAIVENWENPTFFCYDELHYKITIKVPKNFRENYVPSL